MSAIILKENYNKGMISLNTSDVIDIIRFGSDLSEEIKVTSKKVLDVVNSNSESETKTIINNLKKIMVKIHPEELKKINTNQKGIKKVISNILGVKQQLISKYTDIGNELDSMYFSVKQNSLILQENNDLLNDFESKSKESDLKLKEYIQHIEKELENYMSEKSNPSPQEKEKLVIVKQKIGDLKSLEMVISQTIQNIGVTKKTNYLVYKKMFSCYDTILPTIQNQLALNQIGKQHLKMINELQQMDGLKNNLIVENAKDITEAGMSAINLLDNGESTFKAIKDAQNIFNEGVQRMKELENQKMIKLNSILIEYKNRGE